MSGKPYDDMPEGVYKESFEDIMFRDMRKPTKPKRRKSKRRDLEGPVVKECLLLLMEHPDVVYYERRSTGMLPVENGMVRFGAVGAADIWCVVQDGLGKWDKFRRRVHVEIECKRRDGKGELSDNQKKFRDKCYIAGIPYVVVTSADQLRKEIYKITS